MKDASRIQFQPRWWLSVPLLLAALLFGAARSPAEVLVSCLGESGGDWSYRGFYLTNYPGTSLDTVRLKVSSAAPGTYVLSLTALSGDFGGAILGTASTTIVLSGSLTDSQPVIFTFSSVPVVRGSLVCFALKVASGPAANVYYDVGDGSCAQVTQTNDTTPPLSTFRRVGVCVEITGANSLEVSPGGSIQAAIDAAHPGDTVTVAPGTYHESITLRSGVNVIGSGFGSTFLEGIGSNSVVTANYVTNSRLEGFQITGCGTNTYDAGVFLWGGNLMVNNNRIIGNTNGVWIVAGSSAIVRNNVIEGNGNPADAVSYYGIVCDNAAPLIANNLIVSNIGIALRFNRTIASGAQVINNTIVGNQPYGIICEGGASPRIKNNIIAGNGNGLAVYAASPAISFNDVWNNNGRDFIGAAGGLGGISADPRFAAGSLARFTLLSGSPCLDAGDPDPLYNDADGSRNDMGAYGGPSSINAALPNGLASGFLFNSVGIIPTSEITPSGALAGLANVSPAVASALHIEEFEDAPFGGWVWLHGLFGGDNTTVRYYQILAAKWNGGTPPDAASFTPVLDPLSKIKYTIATNSTVVASLVAVGPNANGLYLRTDRPDSGYWAFPDLKLILNTGRLENDRYDFICKAYATESLDSEVPLPPNSLSRITLWIDNNPVSVNIASVRDASGVGILECGIIPVATPQEDLQFEITAYHPTGFLHSYSLGSLYGRNHSGGYVTAEHYQGSHDTGRPSWTGIGPTTQITNALPAMVAGTLAPWQTCAYQFHLVAYARTINGFGRIYGASFDDHYYITLGQTVVSGCPGDLNGDGRVDGADLALFAARFGGNCPTNTIVPATSAAKH